MHSTGETTIRRIVRPGDLGAIVAHHGRLYAREYGVDQSFEADVGVTVMAAGKRGFPQDTEGLWIVEHDGRHAGSLALTDEGDGVGTVRWFVLDPELRGRGIGRRLVSELVQKAEQSGYARLVLMTFSDLRAAAHIYRSHGFEVVWAQTAPRWGRDDFTYQRYELDLGAGGDSLASRGAKGQTRPDGQAPGRARGAQGSARAAAAAG
jgi:ribosomal protein S18 acetylase RimI-like enzyme